MLQGLKLTFRLKRVRRIVKGNLGAFGRGKNTYPDRWKNHKGHYRLAFVENYTKLSPRDIELKLDYAKDLISNYVGTPEDMIKLQLKDRTQKLANMDEVYYVKVGTYTIGKLSIRVTQVLDRPADMSVVYREKRVGDKSKGGTRGFKNSNATKSSKRKNKRKGNSQAGKGKRL